MDSRLTNPFRNKMYGVTSKNVGPFLAFGHDWFEKYQSILLILLNFPILKLWSRWILRIHKDLKYSERICKIDPTRYFVRLSKNQFRLDARTHPKFSKRIYFAFRYWWWILHYIDEALSWLKFNPEFSFGFATLTAYPAEGANSPIDGQVGAGNYTDRTFDQLMALNGGYYSNTGGYGIPTGVAQSMIQASSVSNTFYFCYRYIALFDTSSITNSNNIDSANFSIHLDYAGGTGLSETTMYVCPTNPGSTSTLANSDYQTFSRTDLGNKSSANFTANARTAIALNATGLSSISKTGITKLGLMSGFDFAQSFTGTWTSSRIYGIVTLYQSDQTGTTQDPYLSVTYSAAITTHIGKANNTAYANIKTFINTAIANVKKINNIE